MIFTVKEIAHKINAKVVGNDSINIYGVSSFQDAQADEITFASDIKFLKKLQECNAGAIIIPDTYKLSKFDTTKLTLIQSKEPKLEFFRILSLFYPQKMPNTTISSNAIIGNNFISGVDTTLGHNVVVGDNVKLGNRIHIMANVYIGDDVSIGDDSLIKPNVTILERSKIGSKVIIHSGTVLGSDGFGFTQTTQVHEKIPHAGFVQIDDNVEIGACNTIDRGTFGRTWVGKGTKTDNLVNIAHNVTIGENTLIVAQVGIAGSTSIGKNVIIAGKAGISGHLKIGAGAIVGPGAGVLNDVPSNQIVSGIPEMPHKTWLKVGSILPRLPELRKKILSLEKRFNNYTKSSIREK